MQTSQYDAKFKDAIIAKVLNGQDISELVKKENLPYHTVYNWVYRQKKKIAKIHHNEDPSMLKKRPQNWGAEEKLKAITETYKMSSEQINTYCRENGLYVTHLEEWKQAVIDGINLHKGRIPPAAIKKMEKENQGLRQELRRKEKALAEAAALLVLKKKAAQLWGEDEDD